MTIIICPTERCNYRCTYCFEPEDQRRGLDIPFNINAIKKSVDEIWEGPYGGSDLCLHGGEPTLIPRHQFEELVKYLHSKKGVVSIVTNGSTIDDDMIALFKQYNVYPGVSCDGPPHLNLLRGPDPQDPAATAVYGETLMKTLQKLRHAGLNVAIMCILHTENAGSYQKIEELRNWMLELKHMGITSGRMNPMFGNPSFELSPYQIIDVWRMVHNFNKMEGTQWNPLREMTNNLKGDKVSPCTFAQCDIFTTKTLSILPDGTIGNCDRTFGLGLYLRSKSPGKSGRYEALRQTQCKGCRFWSVCGGACPMEGFDNDWRNKTRFCEAIASTYGMIERELRMQNPNGKLAIDVDYQVPGDKAHGDSPHGDEGHGDGQHMDISHGDDIHGNAPHGDEIHGDSRHGDAPHGDTAHGDSSHYDEPDWK